MTRPARLDEAEVIAGLRAGSEDAFATLVRSLHPSLVRMARLYLPAGVAEEAVQDTWLKVIEHVGGFEGRSSLKTWIFRIMLNTVRTRSGREARVVPFAGAGPTSGKAEPVVDPDRLVHPDLGASYWPAPPSRWETLPEERLMGAEVGRRVADALAALPPSQQEVVVLRDIEGWSSVDVCEALGISAVNQRVLLHRGRSSIRAALEEYLHD